MSRVVLLGAGASKDACLPTSTELTKAISDGLDHDYVRYGKLPQLLHAAIGAIVAHSTLDGGSAFETVDVEQVFAAVKLLSERDELELTPFVQQWSAAASPPATRSLPTFWAKSFSNAIRNSGPFYTKVESSFREGVEAVMANSSADKVFNRLQDRMLAHLRRILSPTDDPDFSYLTSLFKDDAPVRIATLNYDRGVEIAAIGADKSVDTGISAWSGSYGWNWDPAADIQLLKLHGSVDWVEARRNRSNIFGSLVPAYSVQNDAWDVDEQGTYGMIFGSREKLRPDGPFLAMLYEFERWLQAADELVIAGYSLRDEHINVIITRWLSHRDDLRLTIVDPGFPKTIDWVEHTGLMGAIMQQIDRDFTAPENIYRGSVEVRYEGLKEALSQKDL